MSANSSYERAARMASELKETSFVAQKPSRILGGPISVCHKWVYFTWRPDLLYLAQSLVPPFLRPTIELFITRCV